MKNKKNSSLMPCIHYLARIKTVVKTFTSCQSIFFFCLLTTSIHATTISASSYSVWDTIKKILTFDSVMSDHNQQWFSHKEPGELDPKSLNWVKQLLNNFPELNWYATEGVRTCFNYTDQPLGFSWSKELFGNHYKEFDKTVLSVWCFRAFYNGSQTAWKHFIAKQPEKDALTWESFQKIHHELVQFVEEYPGLDKEQVLQAIEAHLILSDAGKTPHAQKKAREKGLISTESKRFFQLTINEFPELYPTLKVISYPAVELLRRTSFPIHMSHLRHLEGHSGMFCRLIQSKIFQNGPEEFEFFYLCDLCDAAAFLGQESVEGSIFLTESMYQANCIAKKACEKTAHLDRNQVYLDYLAERGKVFNFSIDTMQDRVLIRIAAMLRLVDADQGALLKQAFAKLNLHQQALILSQFDARLHDPLRRTPNYIATTLNNFLKNEKLGATFKERLEKTLVLGLPFIATVLKKYRQSLPLYRAKNEPFSEVNQPSDKALNFSQVAKKIALNPYVLNHTTYDLTNQNVVLIE